MSWLGIIGAGLKLLIQLMDWLGSRRPTLEDKIIDIRDDIQKRKDDFHKALEKKEYEKASSQLRNVLADLEQLKRVSQKRGSDSDK